MVVAMIVVLMVAMLDLEVCKLDGRSIDHNRQTTTTTTV